MGLPTVLVQLDDASNGGTWPYDVSSYVRLTTGISITNGRTDEITSITPGSATLTLENIDGRFTLGSTVGSYGAINQGRGIRISLNGTPRFTGYVQSWPVAWPGGGDTYATATITATDVLARLNQTFLYSALEHEYRAAGATQIYMFDVDASDSMSTTGATALVHMPQALTWGQALGLFDINGVNDASIPYADPSGGASFIFPDNSIASATTIGSTVKAGCVWLNGLTWPFTPGWIRERVYILSILLGSGQSLKLFADGLTGRLYWWDTSTAPVLVNAMVLDGHPHLIGFSTSGTALTVLVDGAQIATGTLSSPLNSAGTMVVGQVYRDPDAGNIPAIFAGLSMFPSLSAAQMTRMYQAGITGSATGDNSAPTMAQRIGTYSGRSVSTDAWDAQAMQALSWPSIKGQNAAGVLDAICQSEAGTIAPTGAGTLRWRSRYYRIMAASPAVTLGADALDPGQQITADTQGMTNSVTVSGSSAAAGSYSRTAVDAASVNAIGTYSTTMTSLQTNGDDARIAASNRLATHGSPGPRMGSMNVDLLTNPSLVASVLAADVSDWIQVTGLPSQAVNGTTSLDLIIEGWTDTISTSEWTWAVNSSPRSASVTPVHPWVLDDATYSVLDSTTQLIY